MNDTTTDLDQADEEILTSTVSDEALEAAAGTERGGLLSNVVSHGWFYCC
jgi:hypothetical protein